MTRGCRGLEASWPGGVVAGCKQPRRHRHQGARSCSGRASWRFCKLEVLQAGSASWFCKLEFLLAWQDGRMFLRQDGLRQDGLRQDGLRQDSLRQDGPLEVRFPKDTLPASRHFRRKIPEVETALQVSGHTRTKPRLCLYKLDKEVMEQSSNIDKRKGTKTLVGLAPRWSRGLWMTRGRSGIYV